MVKNVCNFSCLPNCNILQHCRINIRIFAIFNSLLDYTIDFHEILILVVAKLPNNSIAEMKIFLKLSLVTPKMQCAVSQSESVTQVSFPKLIYF